MSPGLDFETRIVVKPQAAALLRKAFAQRSYEAQPIALGANTDPYQPTERSQRITRSILEVMLEHLHPVGIITKSDLVLRDLDLLGPLAERRLAQVFVSITSLDGELARRMEPRAAIPARRLAALRGLVGAGVPCGVLASPMIPGLNDHELETILAAAAEAGAQRAGTILLRLPYELRDLFDQWLEEHYPARKSKVLRLIREARGGRLNDATFGRRMRGGGVYAELLHARFRAALERYGLGRDRFTFDCSQFRRPGSGRQLNLFS
jgi:DNA repair photolyase